MQGTILQKTGVERQKGFSVLQTPFGSFDLSLLAYSLDRCQHVQE